MIFIRSLVSNIVFYIVLIVCIIIAPITFILPRIFTFKIISFQSYHLKINLKYFDGDPVIKEIKRISKPGRRVYSRANSIPKVMNGLGLAILSTPKGVMSDIDARKNNVGGEIICRVF